MRIYILFGQPKNDYPDEHMPSAIEVIDEYGYDEKPLAWLEIQKSEHEASGVYEALAVIAVEIADNDIKRRLFPETDIVPTTVMQ